MYICNHETKKLATLIGNRIFQHDGIDIHSAIALASNPLEMVFVVFGYLNGLDVCCCMCWTQWQWKKNHEKPAFYRLYRWLSHTTFMVLRGFSSQPQWIRGPKPLRWILRCDGSAGAKKNEFWTKSLQKADLGWFNTWFSTGSLKIASIILHNTP